MPTPTAHPRAGGSLLLAAAAVLPIAAGACGRPAAPERARVLAIHPSAQRLPANQLKLYIEFSASMTTRSPYDHLRLIDETTGEEQTAVFHAMRDGLWDRDARRLTVLFDPGRIKRGLTNHEARGLPLEPGHAYRLEISPEWPDALGRPLASGHVKRFEAAPADYRRPALSDWALAVPAAGGREPLRIDHGEPLDAALLRRAFRVTDPDGREVPVEVVLGAAERSVELRPRLPWRPGRHRLEVDPRLEDLAGNNLVRLFDVDRTEPGDAGWARTLLDLHLRPHGYLISLKETS